MIQFLRFAILALFVGSTSAEAAPFLGRNIEPYPPGRASPLGLWTGILRCGVESGPVQVGLLLHDETAEPLAVIDFQPDYGLPPIARYAERTFGSRRVFTKISYDTSVQLAQSLPNSEQAIVQAGKPILQLSLQWRPKAGTLDVSFVGRSDCSPFTLGRGFTQYGGQPKQYTSSLGPNSDFFVSASRQDRLGLNSEGKKAGAPLVVAFVGGATLSTTTGYCARNARFTLSSPFLSELTKPETIERAVRILKPYVQLDCPSAEAVEIEYRSRAMPSSTVGPIVSAALGEGPAVAPPANDAVAALFSSAPNMSSGPQADSLTRSNLKDWLDASPYQRNGAGKTFFEAVTLLDRFNGLQAGRVYLYSCPGSPVDYVETVRNARISGLGYTTGEVTGFFSTEYNCGNLTYLLGVEAEQAAFPDDQASQSGSSPAKPFRSYACIHDKSKNLIQFCQASSIEATSRDPDQNYCTPPARTSTSLLGGCTSIAEVARVAPRQLQALRNSFAFNAVVDSLLHGFAKQIAGPPSGEECLPDPTLIVWVKPFGCP